MLTGFAATLSAKRGPRSYLLTPGQEIAVDYPESIDEEIDELLYKFLSGAPLTKSEMLPFSLSKQDLEVLTLVHKAVPASEHMSTLVQCHGRTAQKRVPRVQKEMRARHVHSGRVDRCATSS